MKLPSTRPLTFAKYRFAPEITLSVQIKKKNGTFGFSLKPTALKAPSSSVDITKDKSTRERAENAECLVTFPGFFFCVCMSDC